MTKGKIFLRVMGDDIHTKAASDFACALTNISVANHTESFASEFRNTNEIAALPATVFHQIIELIDFVFKDFWASFES
jgi:hypothetical protein